MSAPHASPSGDSPQERRLRHTWWAFGGSFFALALTLLLRLLVDPGPGPVVVAGLALLAACAALLHRNAVRELEAGRRAEAESFARIFQGLSRSVSPEAIVDAIVEELGVGTGADHIVVVRRQPESGVVEATLVSSRAGVRSATTRLPPSDLEDPLEDVIGVREPVAIPIAAAELELVGGPTGTVLLPRDPFGGRRTSQPIAPPAASALPPRAATPSRVARELVADLARAGAAVARGQLHAEPAAAHTRRPQRRLVAERQATPAVNGGKAFRIAGRIAERARSTYGLRNTLAAPLVTEEGVVGAIVVSRRGPEPWPASAHRILNGAAIEASAALARATHHRAAETRATTDALTGLPNRRYFEEFCGLLARRRRADDAVGVLLIDIDWFKQVNDTWGHPAGDHVLRSVARAITSAVREGDVPTRFGGEEFAVLLRNPSREVAVDVAERVRAAVGRLQLGDVGPERVSVSIGVAVAGAGDQPIAEVVEAADRALYEAKRAGRDRVVAG